MPNRWNYTKFQRVFFPPFLEILQFALMSRNGERHGFEVLAGIVNEPQESQSVADASA